MQIYLKVKIKSLASESKMIRHEERKVKTSRAYRRKAKRLVRLGKENNPIDKLFDQKGSFSALSNVERDLAVKMAQAPSTEALIVFEGLRHHRTKIVRPEARDSHLAYGYLRGYDYRHIEEKAKLPPDWLNITYMVKKYGTKEQTEALSVWIDNAKSYRELNNLK